MSDELATPRVTFYVRGDHATFPGGFSIDPGVDVVITWLEPDVGGGTKTDRLRVPPQSTIVHRGIGSWPLVGDQGKPIAFSRPADPRTL